MSSLKSFLNKLLHLILNEFLVERVKHYLSYRLVFSKWLKIFPKTIKDNLASTGNIIVSLNETNHPIFIPLLILAKALELRGFNIIVFVCDGFLKGCEIKSSKNVGDKNPCWQCKFNIKSIISRFNFKIVSYATIFSKKEINQINQKIKIKDYAELDLDNFLEGPMQLSVNDSVIRYFYGAVDDKESNEIINNNTDTAIFSYLSAKRLDKIYSPVSVVSAMSAYSQWSPFYHYFNKSNRFKKLSLIPFNLATFQINDFELYSNTNRFIKYRELKNNKISFEESEELSEYLTTRFSGKSEIFVRDGFFKESIDKLDLTIDPDKKNIFLFSNIYWDVGVSESNYLYDDVIQWVLETIDMLSDKQDINLFIKPHPGEVYDSSSSLKTMSDFIYERFPVLPKNVQIISPEQQIKTYDLFDYIDLGLIYNGTIGLEMMLKGIPVISTGKTTYQDLNFAMQPKTADEYLNLILEDTYNIPSKEDLEFYAYFYFLKTPVPFDIFSTYNASFTEIPKLDSLDELNPGKSNIIDHFCKCLTEKDSLPEAW